MSFTESGKPRLLPDGQVPRDPTCIYCGHAERFDLRPAFDSNDALVIQCADEALCDLRSYAAERHLGLHIEAEFQRRRAADASIWPPAICAMLAWLVAVVWAAR